MNRITRLGGAAAALALTVAGIALVPTAASASVPTDGVTECSVPPGAAALWQRMPEELQQDLRDLRSIPDGERADAARVIRDDALAGEYGAEVQDRAERLRDLRLLRWSAAPEELRADLKEVRAADATERAALRQAVVDRALAGEYGEGAQRRAERLQERAAWLDCVVAK